MVPRKYLIAIDQGWNDQDVTVHRGIWARADLKVAVENHGGNKRLFRNRIRVHASRLARITLAACAVLAIAGALGGLAEIAELGILLGLLTLAMVILESFRLGRVLYHVLEIVAKHIGLSGVNGNQQAAPLRVES